MKLEHARYIKIDGRDKKLNIIFRGNARHAASIRSILGSHHVGLLIIFGLVSGYSYLIIDDDLVLNIQLRVVGHDFQIEPGVKKGVLYIEGDL